MGEFWEKHKDKFITTLMVLGTLCVMFGIYSLFFKNNQVLKQLNEENNTSNGSIIQPMVSSPDLDNIALDKVDKDLGIATNPIVESVKIPNTYLPIMIFDTYVGVTQEKNGDTVVGFYDVNKINNTYRRYFAYTCSKANKLVRYENGDYFVFARDKSRQYLKIAVLVVSVDKYSVNDIDRSLQALEMINQSNRISFTLMSGQTVVINIKERKTNKLPCL